MALVAARGYVRCTVTDMTDTQLSPDVRSGNDPGVILNAVTPLSAIHLRVKAASKSPLLPGASWDFTYGAQSGSPLGTDVQQLAGFVTASISSVPSGGVSAPAKFLSSTLNSTANAQTWEAYDVSAHLDGSPAGSPVTLGSWTLTGNTNVGNMPEECAIAITMQAGYGTDVEFAPGARPRARDRGRNYFGPCAVTLTVLTDINGRTGIIPQCQKDLGFWIKAINTYTSAASSINWQLAVWSRKSARLKTLNDVWIDDRFDSQRRRAGKSGNKWIQALP